MDPPEKKPGSIDVKKERPKERPKDPPFIPRKEDLKPPIVNNNDYPEPETGDCDLIDYPNHPIYPIIIPEHAISKYKIEGIKKFKDGDYVGALVYFNFAIVENPDDFEIYFYRGLVELELEFFEDAERDFNIYLEYVFNIPEPYFQRGLAKFYLNEKAEAKEDFQIAADMDHKLAISILKRFY